MDTLLASLHAWRTDIPWTEVFVYSGWVIRLVMLVVVPFRRSPAAAKGWLLLIFFQPWVGLGLYLVFGQPIIPRWREERFKRLPQLLRKLTAHMEGLAKRRGLAPSRSLPAEAEMMRKLSQLPPLGGNAVEFLNDYDGTLDHLTADIDEAKKQVHLLFYTFAHDRAGKQVSAALKRAVQRGVTCRVLIDAIGSDWWVSWWTVRRLQKAGVQAHLILPVNPLRPRLLRADVRNHRKIAVVDGCVGYMGSQNIVKQEATRGLRHEELVVRVAGPVVMEMQAVFYADWFLETEEALSLPELMCKPLAQGQVVAQVLPSGPDYSRTGVDDLILSLVYAARERVVITTPYFVPTDALLQALRGAVLRGVSVDLILSKVMDTKLVALAQRSYYGELLDAGINIYLYKKLFLHAKHLSIDTNIALIGSSNLDVRSFQLNAEASLIFYDTAVNAQLQREQERCLATCERVSPQSWHRRRLPIKVLENLARLLSPLL